jgi:hypothetical protein
MDSGSLYKIVKEEDQIIGVSPQFSVGSFTVELVWEQ